MKKTLTINLNNAVFHIDEDAYELLQAYLNEVGNHFKSENEKADIMADIEARIAELFTEKMEKTKNVITIEDVDSVIAIMGKPSQFVDEDPEEGTESESKSDGTTKSRKSKKYYRDVENRSLSGVASGLAAYLNWDVTLVRIIFVVLAFITSGTFILIYLLMWLIVPKAETTAQKLEMQGEDVNIETIKNKMIDAKEYIESDKFKKSATEAGSRLFELLHVFFKIIFTLVGGLISIIGVIIIAGLIFGLIVFLLEPEAITGLHPELFSILGTVSPEKAILLLISMILIIGAPIFALLYWSMNTIFKNNQNRSKSGLWVSLFLWLAGIFMFLGTGADVINKIKNSEFISHYRLDDDFQKRANVTTEKRTVAPFHALDVSGAVDVDLIQSNEQSLSVRSLSEYLPNIQTVVTDGVLKIFVTESLINPKIKVRISLDSLSSIQASKASKIDFENSFNVKNLNILLLGASKADLKLSSAQKLDVNVSGASTIEASGIADTLTIVGTDASRVEADDLKSKIVKVEMGGASNAEVFAAREFTGKAHGASKIKVSGNPLKRYEDSYSGSSIVFDNH